MTYIGQHNSHAQNSVQMYLCIYNFVTEAAHLNILDETYKFTFQGTSVGGLLFNFFVKKAVINKRETVYCIRKNLTKLEIYITMVNSNIQTFNQHLKLNLVVLKERYDSTYYLMINLFRAYHLELYTEFFRYIETNKDRHDDGKDFSLENIMSSALNKYEILITSIKWRLISPEK